MDNIFYFSYCIQLTNAVNQNMKSIRSEVGLATKEPMKHEVAEQLVGDALKHGFTPSKIVENKETLSLIELPVCIFRGSEGKVSDRLMDDNFWHPRQTLRRQLCDALNRILIRIL